MSTIAWNETFTLGVPEMDEQHREVMEDGYHLLGRRERKGAIFDGAGRSRWNHASRLS